MEREKEIAKLVNVLRRTSRMALQSEWTGGGQDAAKFCVEQYNRVLARLKEIDASLATVFDPLATDSSLTVAAMACRQLAAYYEDEVGQTGPWGRAHAAGGAGFDPKAFKDFWQKSARDLEDLGEFIRESIEEWARQRKGKSKPGEADANQTSQQETKTTNRL
jgi:hypothetical protein